MKELSPAGHRRRVKQRYCKDGLQTFQPHEVLELLMFFTIPRRDTKQYTYALISNYENLNSVFSAPKSELVKFKGVTEKTADLFTFLPEIWAAFDKPRPIKCLFPLEKMSGYAVSLFKNCTTPDFMIILLDISGCVIFQTKLFEGDISLLEDYIHEIIEYVSVHHAACVVCAHNRPEMFKAYNDDIWLINRLAFILKSTGAPLRDHIIVNGSKYISFLLKNYLKTN